MIVLESRLVLQNDGGDDLTIARDGTFHYPTAFEDSSSYSVTVHSEPPLQNCELSGRNETIHGADITDILGTLTDRWNYPSDLTDYISPSSWSEFAPQVAVYNDSNAIIVWWQAYFSDGQIFMGEFHKSAIFYKKLTL